MDSDNSQLLAQMENQDIVNEIFNKFEECVSAFTHAVTVHIQDVVTKKALKNVGVHFAKFRMLAKVTSEHSKAGEIYAQDVQSLLELMRPDCTAAEKKNFIEGKEELIREAKRHQEKAASFKQGFDAISKGLTTDAENIEKRYNEIKSETQSIQAQIKKDKHDRNVYIAKATVAVVVATGATLASGGAVFGAGALVAGTAGGIGAGAIGTIATAGIVGTGVIGQAANDAIKKANTLSTELKNDKDQLEILDDVTKKIGELKSDLIAIALGITIFYNFWAEMETYLNDISNKYADMEKRGIAGDFQIRTVIGRWKKIEKNYRLYANEIPMIVNGQKLSKYSIASTQGLLTK